MLLLLSPPSLICMKWTNYFKHLSLKFYIHRSLQNSQSLNNSIRQKNKHFNFHEQGSFGDLTVLGWMTWQFCKNEAIWWYKMGWKVTTDSCNWLTLVKHVYRRDQSQPRTLQMMSPAKDCGAHIPEIFWLHYCSTGGSVNVSSIFIFFGSYSICTCSSSSTNRVLLLYTHTLTRCACGVFLLGQQSWSSGRKPWRAAVAPL